jgi:hypothetical protein
VGERPRRQRHCAAGTTAWAIGPIALKPGANVLTVTASDAAGNKTAKAFTATQTDGDAPAIAITSPTASASYSTGNDTVALGARRATRSA